MWGLDGIIAQWSSLFSNHAALRTAVSFAHVAALLAAGGCAIAADRGTLLALRQDAASRRAQLIALDGTHRIVTIGLAFIVASGLLLFAADLDTFLYSWTFWIKMGLLVALLVNGAVLRGAEHRALGGAETAWRTLRLTAIASLALWFLVTLGGAALPNVG